jgi:hypothetical protein
MEGQEVWVDGVELPGFPYSIITTSLAVQISRSYNHIVSLSFLYIRCLNIFLLCSSCTQIKDWSSSGTVHHGWTLRLLRITRATIAGSVEQLRATIIAQGSNSPSGTAPLARAHSLGLLSPRCVVCCYIGSAHHWFPFRRATRLSWVFPGSSALTAATPTAEQSAMIRPCLHLAPALLFYDNMLRHIATCSRTTTVRFRCVHPNFMR